MNILILLCKNADLGKRERKTGLFQKRRVEFIMREENKSMELTMDQLGEIAGGVEKKA